MKKELIQEISNNLFEEIKRNDLTVSEAKQVIDVLFEKVRPNIANKKLNEVLAIAVVQD
jgi:nucleoid DNA-binding protein